jgi:hypothetical protein
MRFSEISGLEINEAATLVKIQDGDTYRTYWVKKSTPEKAISDAIKKHRERAGLGRHQSTNDHDLKAEIVRTTEKDPE